MVLMNIALNIITLNHFVFFFKLFKVLDFRTTPSVLFSISFPIFRESDAKMIYDTHEIISAKSITGFSARSIPGYLQKLDL